MWYAAAALPLPTYLHYCFVRMLVDACFHAGIAAYLNDFASPGDPEYEPPGPPEDKFPEPRLFRNKEYALQVRLEEETKLEK